MEIVPASPDRWPALADLFAAGGDPKWCWCQFWRKPGSNWTNTTADDNRASLRALVDEEPAPGLVALRDGVAVGWVGLGPREAFGRLERSRTIPRLEGDDVWSINCFVVARRERGQGIADALLAGRHRLRQRPTAPGSSRATRSRPRAGCRRPARTPGPAACSTGPGSRQASETTSKASGGRPRVVMRREP